MEDFDLISELKTIYKDGVSYSELDRHLSEADVMRWSTLPGWSRSRYFEEVAKCLARGFDTLSLSLRFATP